MPAYKDKQRNTWTAKFKHKNWCGETKWVTKRGFPTKREALQYERDFLFRLSGSLDMLFADFVQVYLQDREPRIKDSTIGMKRNIIDTKLLPYFGQMRVRDIAPIDIMRWQNTLITFRQPDTGKPYSKSYLKTVHNQLTAIFNHAVKFYNLSDNPARTVGNMGTNRGIQMKIWTLEQYLQFSELMMDDPILYYYFQVLYWCGLREGEALALTPDDFNLAKNTVSVTKTYHRIGGQDIITEPKTPKSNRVVEMPAFLTEEIQEYLTSIPDLKKDSRIFPLAKSTLYRQMEKAHNELGLPRIRVHDLRHSHVSLLINIVYSAVAITDRMGHESIDITYRYAHLSPNVQTSMANDLNRLQGGCL
jgi:integrase